ncbi:TetR/AcrR family transcriptional regulator [Paracoccus sp. 1_MG-2023]|uniref:TetR/AcrR family transcriptional regulator n=1 Tax=unclassified Paracoccus (in: a-proteobacteria) TaxID=2688777 RepID=UPI001C09A6E1|nr:MULTISPECIES: TetR/AcrR family transcriptional regulator [unclassified Paracoccus (in: a-proteobacteria)]MBU2958207.1 TetR/AcrR family transcriptional regulator [Paracoccus sp. C2R09]MDO6668334.1 TetR/AcrR family transcriptional regulator [Paracoccus sp. 1_MG-2023]
MTGAASRSSLRDRLIEAGLEILDETGIEELTLRRVAARAGVSHAAPAHHFGSLSGLQNAIAICGFERLRDKLGLIEDALPDDIAPYDRLARINNGYLEFSATQPGLFQLMFSHARHLDPKLQRAASDTWAVLERATQSCVAPDRQETVRTAIWAMTHGYAVLGLNRQRPNAPQTAAPFDELLRLLLRPDAA